MPGRGGLGFSTKADLVLLLLEARRLGLVRATVAPYEAGYAAFGGLEGRSQRPRKKHEQDQLISAWRDVGGDSLTGRGTSHKISHRNYVYLINISKNNQIEYSVSVS